MRALKPGSLSPNHASEMARIGGTIARLRRSSRMKQEVAALQAGLSRDTAYRIEKGESNVAIGHILRYLDVISPGLALKDILVDNKPDVNEARQPEKRRRVYVRTPAVDSSNQDK
ncbi:UNVERIFIED_ORG: helix-turn-helix protein [Herbaspirillum seropedicae]